MNQQLQKHISAMLCVRMCTPVAEGLMDIASLLGDLQNLFLMSHMLAEMRSELGSYGCLMY